MDRTPETEVMDDDEQCLAYARADFAEVNQSFVDRFLNTFRDRPIHTLIDLGCGPADIPIRLCRALPELRVTAIDASAPMLELGRQAASRCGLANRLLLNTSALPLPAPERGFDAVVSNSLLHHLPDAAMLWSEVRRQALSAEDGGTAVYVMDLLRPTDRGEAQSIVDTYAPDEPDVLRTDFFNSLLAAYRPDEIRNQLDAAGLGNLSIETPSDRHFVVHGLVTREQ